MYVREDIPANILAKENAPTPLETIYIELNKRNTKWLLYCSYNSHENMIEQDLALSEYLDLYSNYEKILILGDFNVSVKEII